MRCAECDGETDVIPCGLCGCNPKLDGRYALVAPCGQGANGTTWKATSEDGRLVAIKELPLSSHLADKSRELWMREARVLKELDHPQIPSLVEVFLTGTGRARTLCIVQEFVEGQTLAEELESHRYTEAEVLVIARELAGILAYLHGLSPPVVHRDLKPGNVMRRPDGTLMLVDFGSVRDVLKDPNLGGSTTAGTFGFMAPEQFRGDAEPATDFYGLGCLMIALLTRKDPGTLHQRDGDVSWRDHCVTGPETTRLLEGLLASDPADRPVGLPAMERLLVPGFADADAFAEARQLFEPTPQRELPARPSSNALVPAIFGGLTAASGLLFVGVCFMIASLLFLVQFSSPTPSSPVAIPTTPSPEAPSVAPLPKAPPAARSPRKDVKADLLFIQNADHSSVQIDDPVVGMTPLGGGKLRALTVAEYPFRLKIEQGTKGMLLDLSARADGYLDCSIDGCVSKPFRTAPNETWSRRELPVWPEGMTRDEPQTCQVHTWLDRDGTVVEARATDCDAPFAEAAERSIRTWTNVSGSRPMYALTNVVFKNRP